MFYSVTANLGKPGASGSKRTWLRPNSVFKGGMVAQCAGIPESGFNGGPPLVAGVCSSPLADSLFEDLR